jgi:hypothetical protein
MGEWRFFHDIGGSWQWVQLDAQGKTLKESARAFASLDSCLSDAQKHGLGSDHLVRFPGEVVRLAERRKKPRPKPNPEGI